MAHKTILRRNKDTSCTRVELSMSLLNLPCTHVNESDSQPKPIWGHGQRIQLNVFHVSGFVWAINIFYCWIKQDLQVPFGNVLVVCYFLPATSSWRSCRCFGTRDVLRLCHRGFGLWFVCCL